MGSPRVGCDERLHVYTLSKFGVSSPDEAYSGEGVCLCLRNLGNSEAYT